MNKIVVTFLYYFIAFVLVFLAHKIDPTNLAGPGLDLLVYPVVFIGCVVLLGRSFYVDKGLKTFWLIISIHLLGLVWLVLILFIPANIW